MKSPKEIQAIICDNRRRAELYFREYSRELGDPLSEAIDRKELLLNGTRLFVPVSMFSIPFVAELSKFNSVGDMLSAHLGTFTPEDEQEVLSKLNNERFKYDFEFWAAHCVKIQHKISKQIIPLLLNRGQRKLLKKFEDQRLAGKPIRTIVVKARQWGGSTLTQMYMLWLQLFHYENWHSVVISKDKTQSANIINMCERAINNLPKELGEFTFEASMRTQNIRKIPQRGCNVLIGSAEEPDAARSFDMSMCHLSEVALWPETSRKSGSDLAQSLYATIPDAPGTFICLESTAKGIGNFFHERWLSAESGESELNPIFVPWFDIQMYTTKMSDFPKFTSSMSDYNWWQWKQGATLEGINWYNHYKKAKGYTDFQMKSEFPTTAAEAFQTKSGRYFPDNLIEIARATCREPLFIGDIRGASLVGKESLKGISIQENNTGGSEILKIWSFPERPDNEKMLYQYLVVVDIGGKHFKSDNSKISVYDRSTLMSPFGALEKIATWSGHIDHDILAWKAAQIATYYNNALLVIESNTIDSRDKKQADSVIYEGDHFYTVIDELADEYENLYARGGTPDKTTGVMETKYGWHMNKKTKYLAYDRYTAALRQDEFVERSHDAVNEMEWLQVKPNGQIEAQMGKRDDETDVNAIACYVGLEEMPTPKIVQVHNKPAASIRQKKSVGVAGF